MVQAVFWDYDNTLLETSEAHWYKHHIVLARYGIILSEESRQRIYENNGKQNWEWMKNELNLTVPEVEYLAAIDDEFHQQIQTLKLRPGVEEVLHLFDELAIPQAIITNGRRSSVEPVLKAKQLDSFMKCILCKEDYKGRKPEPAPYLEGFRKMYEIIGRSINPKECLAIEDDLNGIKSAYYAGATVIHRKLNAIDKDSPYAHYCCFEKKDFIHTIKQLLQ